MNFREALLSSMATGSPRQVKAMYRLKEAKRPRLWRMLENMVAHKYEVETGNKIGAGFDWSTILDWLITNGPAILKIVLMILGVMA